MLRTSPIPRGLLAGALLLATSTATAAGGSLADLYDRVHGSVVDVVTSRHEPPTGGGDRQARTGSVGTGFLVSRDGRIVTAAHVVTAADAVAVQFATGEIVSARVVASDPAMDLALIRADRVPSGTPVAVLGDSDGVRVGDEIFVVGSPRGISQTLTAGHVSGRRSTDTLLGGFDPRRLELFQTDAALNEGNSGSPVFDMEGRVVGVVSAIMTSSGGSQGLGFAVTSNLARAVLLENPPPWYGLELMVVEGELARALNIPGTRALLVQRVATGSRAERLGLRPGTIRASIGGRELLLGGTVILEVAGVSLEEPGALERIRAATGQRDPASLEITVLEGGRPVPLRPPE